MLSDSNQASAKDLDLEEASAFPKRDGDSPIADKESFCSKQATAKLACEDLVARPTLDQRNQLAQLAPAGVRKILKYIECNVADDNCKMPPLLVDATDEPEAIALLSFLPHALGKGCLKGESNLTSTSKPVLIIAASAPSLLKLKIMLGKDSILANIMHCNEKDEPYYVCVVPRHASKQRDVVLAGAFHYHYLRKDFCSAVVVYESNSLKADVAKEIVQHFQARTILVRTPQYSREDNNTLSPINVKHAIQQNAISSASIQHQCSEVTQAKDFQLDVVSGHQTVDAPSSTVRITSNSLQLEQHGPTVHQSSGAGHFTVKAAGSLLPSEGCISEKIEEAKATSGHLEAGVQGSNADQQDNTIPAQTSSDFLDPPQQGVAANTSMRTQRHKFSFFKKRRRESGLKDKNVRLTVKDTIEERNSSQQTLRASLCSCFRRNRCALDYQETKEEEPRRSRFSFFRRRNNNYGPSSRHNK